MFLILFGFSLVLMGVCTFLWVGEYRELVGVEPRAPRIPKPKKVKEPKAKNPKNAKNKKTRKEKTVSTPAPLPSFEFDQEEEEEVWDHMEPISRDRESLKERKSMDERFGFGPSSRPAPSMSEPSSSPPKRELSFEERYASIIGNETFEEEQEQEEEVSFEQPEPEKKRSIYEPIDFGKLPTPPKLPKREPAPPPPPPIATTPENDTGNISERLQNLARMMDENQNKNKKR